MSLTADQAAALLNQLYLAVLGRQPDAAAAAMLIPQLQAGTDPATIRVQLAIGSTESAVVVGSLYQSVLGHAPDDAGAAAVLAGLAAGTLSVATTRTLLASTPEAANVIGTLYQQVLGRAADPQGLALNVAALGVGASPGGLRQQLAASPEAAAAVRALYQQVLGRPADTPGVVQFTAGLGTTLTLADVRAQLAASPESQAGLATSFELNFGRAPAAGTLAALTTELSLGRSFVASTQVTANFVMRGDAFFTYNYGYAIPAQFAAAGAQQFLQIYQNVSPLQIGAAFTTVPIPTVGASSGPDTITVNLRTLANAPVSFTATVDGRSVGGATVTAGPPTGPFDANPQNQVTFIGSFGGGLHDLHIQVAGDPAANALTLPGTATFDANQFLLGGLTTGATGGADIFPHAGPQPPIIYGPSS